MARNTWKPDASARDELQTTPARKSDTTEASRDTLPLAHASGYLCQSANCRSARLNARRVSEGRNANDVQLESDTTGEGRETFSLAYASGYLSWQSAVT